MGVRKGNKGTGKSPAFKDDNFITECQVFFLSQLEMQKPKVIFVLGKETAQFLSELSVDLNGWKRISTFKDVDGRNQQVILNAVFENGISTNLVLLTHPSFRHLNLKNRSYKGLIGNEAEMKLAEIALS